MAKHKQNLLNIWNHNQSPAVLTILLKCLSDRSVWSTKAQATLHSYFLTHVSGLTEAQCLVLPLLCRLGSLINTFWKEAWKRNCRHKIPLPSGTQASFEKVAEGETTVQALFIFCNIQSCHGLDSMAGRLWGLQSLKKDTAIYMEALWISPPFETIHAHFAWTV